MKPDGDLEFMARTCAGCPTTFLATGHVDLPAVLSLTRDVNTGTFTAAVAPDAYSPTTVIGTVTVSMSAAIGGVAVTSHDASALATATDAAN